MAAFPDVLQHEKFTSGLQLSHKPSSGEPHAAAHKSPAKTPAKAARSPRATADGLPSPREPQTKPAEERSAGETAASLFPHVGCCHLMFWRVIC